MLCREKKNAKRKSGETSSKLFCQYFLLIWGINEWNFDYKFSFIALSMLLGKTSSQARVLCFHPSGAQISCLFVGKIKGFASSISSKLRGSELFTRFNASTKHFKSDSKSTKRDLKILISLNWVVKSSLLDRARHRNPKKFQDEI